MSRLALLFLFSASAASAATYEAKVYSPAVIATRYPMALDAEDFEDRCVGPYSEVSEAFYGKATRLELNRAAQRYVKCVRSTWMDR